jgi:hypothetical protein
MQNIGFRPPRRLLKTALSLALAFTLGCETSPPEEANAGKSDEAMVSVDSAPVEVEREIDGDVYLPYYKEADLPKLELTPLETPPAVTQADLIRELWGESNPSNPDRFRAKPRPKPAWVPLPQGPVSGEIYEEIVAFLRTDPAMTTGIFQICQIWPKEIYEVLHFTTKYSSDESTQVVAIDLKRFQVEKGDSQWQIRSPTEALSDVSDQPGNNSAN